MSTAKPSVRSFKTFLILWVTQSISVIGSTMMFFGITIWLTKTVFPAPEQQPQLALALTTISLAFAIPALVVGPLAGALADRWDRRRIMIVADFGNALLSAVMAALLFTGSLEFWMLPIIAVVMSTLGIFHNLSFDASYIMIVPEGQLPRANGMMQTMWALAGIIAPAVAATLIALPVLLRGSAPGTQAPGLLRALGDGIPLVAAVDAVTFFLAGTALLFLHIPSPRPIEPGPGQHPGVAQRPSPAQRPSIWADVKEGALYIWRRRPLLWLLGTFTVANLCFAPAGVLFPLLVKFQLSADWMARGFTLETAMALLNTVVGIGGVVGGVIISTWGGLKSRRVLGVVVPILVASLAMAATGVSSYLYLAAAFAVVFAAMGPIMNAHSQTIWQIQTPPELQGRVFSVRRVIAQFSGPIGTAMAGAAAGLFSVPAVFLVAGLLAALFCVAQLFNPVLMRVEDKAWLDGMAARAEAAAAADGGAR